MKPSKALSLLLSLCLALFWLTAAVSVPILCRPFYYAQADALELSAQTGLDQQTIREAYDDVMDYLVWDEPFGTGALKWSESGKAHFQDCKALFQLNFVLLGFSAALLVLLAVLRRAGRPAFHRFLGRSPAFWAAAGLTSLFLLAAIWALLDFDSLFTAFHHIFFPGKTNWVFDWRTDEIILILPEAFWARTGALVLGISLGGAWLTAAAAHRLSARRK